MAEDPEDLRQVFDIDDALPLLYDTGFNKSISDLRLTDKTSMITSLIDYHLMVKVKAQMDQLKEGLCALGFLDLLMKTPEQWQCYFLARQDDYKVTAGDRI